MEEKYMKMVLIRGKGNEQTRIIVKLYVLRNGYKMLLYVILRTRMRKRDSASGLGLSVPRKRLDYQGYRYGLDQGCLELKTRLLSKQCEMIVLDAFKGHNTQEVKEYMQKENTDLIVIPSGMTSQLQLLVTVINKPFKDHL
jgi:hypothetical protein